MLQSFLFSLLMLFSTAEKKTTTYKVNTKESKIEWLGKKITGKHMGFINVKSGSLEMADGKLKGGSFEIDMNSITCTDLEGEWRDKLVGHLKSDDFFGVQNHPTAKLVITKVEGGSNGKYKVTGDVTIKGKTNAVTFEATVSEKGGKVTANAEITLDRTKWDIKYGSSSFFDGLGDKAIYNDFNLTVSLVAAK